MEFIKYRLKDDLWWGKVRLDVALRWGLSLYSRTNESVFCEVDTHLVFPHGRLWVPFRIELTIDDFNKLMNSKAFNTKFKIKKHDLI